MIWQRFMGGLCFDFAKELVGLLERQQGEMKGVLEICFWWKELV